MVDCGDFEIIRGRHAYPYHFPLLSQDPVAKEPSWDIPTMVLCSSDALMM